MWLTAEVNDCCSRNNNDKSRTGTSKVGVSRQDYLCGSEMPLYHLPGAAQQITLPALGISIFFLEFLVKNIVFKEMRLS